MSKLISLINVIISVSLLGLTVIALGFAFVAAFQCNIKASLCYIFACFISLVTKITYTYVMQVCYFSKK